MAGVSWAAAAASFDAAPVVGAPGDDEGFPALNRDAVYEGCPVTPLGVNGATCYYLDVADQLREVSRHDKEAITSLFGGREDSVRRAWPRFGKPKPDGSATINGFDGDAARAALIKACFERGVWNAANRVRGVGAWPGAGADEPPVMHCGDRVLIQGVAHAPGLIGEHIYPSDQRQPRPHPDPVRAVDGPGWTLLRTLETWRLAGGAADARLILGWLGCAMVGGALDWRPMLWLTGGAGSGKSLLDKLMVSVLGGEASVVASSDPSEAGIRQQLRMSSRPVLLDEIESEAQAARARAVIKLARQAASGGVILRGGADHQGQEFKARSCFKFSSILIPSLGDQDISRLAVVEMEPFERGSTPPAIDLRTWSLVGRQLRRLILDAWPRWHATLEAYRGALAHVGHSARGCDQFGALLGMADMMLHPGAPDHDTVDEAVRTVTAERIAQRMDTAQDHDRCLRYLAAQLADRHYGGGKVTLGELVAAAADMTDGEPVSPREANRELARVGLRVIGRGAEATVAVANAHDGLRRVFEGSRWSTEHGQTGVWAQSIRRAPGAVASASSMGFARAVSRAWVVPLGALVSVDSEAGDAETVLSRDLAAF